jgi:hypothetical protein
MGLHERKPLGKPAGIPENNQVCEHRLGHGADRRKCGQKALGFAVYETTHEGLKTILPIGWRCFNHRTIRLQPIQWYEVRGEFERRTGKAPGQILAGISTLTEEEVLQLYFLMQDGAVMPEPERIPVEMLGGDDLKEALGRKPQ